MQKKADEIIVLIYAVDQTIYFMSSSVISHGLLIAKNEFTKTISEKVISNVNYGFLELGKSKMKITKKVTARIISNEINYEKELIFK